MIRGRGRGANARGGPGGAYAPRGRGAAPAAMPGAPAAGLPAAIVPAPVAAAAAAVGAPAVAGGAGGGGGGGGPPVAGALVPAAGVGGHAVRGRKTREQVVRDFMKGFQVRVSQAKLIDFAKRFPYVSITLAQGGVANPHELLAGIRMWATAQCLGQLVLDGHMMIDSFWGAGRDLNVMRWINEALAREGYAPVQLNVHGGVETAADVVRARAAQGQPVGTAAFFMDVYWMGKEPNGADIEITPGQIATLPHDTVVWVGHRFDGQFGGCDTAAWYRDAEGLVNWRSDDICGKIYRHPDCGWLHRDGASGHFAWFVSKYYSAEAPSEHVYSVTKFVRSNADPYVGAYYSGWVDVPIGMVPKGSTMENMWTRLQYWWFNVQTETVTVKRTHLHELGMYLGARGKNSFVYAGARAKAIEVLNKDKDFVRVSTMHPEAVIDYPDQLANAAFCHGLDRQVNRLATLRRDHGEQMHQYNVHRQNLDSSLPYKRDYTLSWLVGIIVMFILKMIWKKIVNYVFWGIFGWLQSFLTAMVVYEPSQSEFEVVKGYFILFYIILGAPVLEEWFKRWAYKYIGPLGILLVVWGDMKQYEGRQDVDLTGLFVVHFCLHYFFYTRTQLRGTIYHCLWNLKSVVAMVLMMNVPGNASARFPYDLEILITGVVIFVFGLLWKKIESYKVIKMIREFDETYYRSARYLSVTDDRRVTGYSLVNVEVPAYVYSNETDLPERDPTNYLNGKSLVEYTDADLRLMMDYLFTGVEVDRIGYWRVWFVNVPMFKPAKCAENFKAILFQRLWKKPKHKYAAKQIVQPAGVRIVTSHTGLPMVAVNYENSYRNPYNWHYLGKLFVQFPCSYGEKYNYSSEGTRLCVLAEADVLPSTPLEQYEAWLQHTDPSKRPIYDSAFAKLRSDFPSVTHPRVRSVQINIKTDEVLMKSRSDIKEKGAIPRPIHAVDPTVSVAVGISLYPVSEAIKKVWNGRRVCLTSPIKVQFYLTYGAGRTDQFLTEWLRFALNTVGIHIIAAGDDSLVIERTVMGIRVFEGDLTMMDQTVRKEALSAEFEILRAFGLDRGMIGLLSESCSACCVINAGSRDKGVCSFTRDQQRNTGGVDTTVGNTVVTLMAWTAAMMLIDGGEEIDPTVVFAGLGMELKLKVFQYQLGTNFPATFLKGCWIHDDTQLVWGPLPSRWLKLSKTINDPRLTMRKPGERKLNYEEALIRFFRGTIAGMSVFANPKFLDEKLSDHPWSRIEDLVADWKVKGVSGARWNDEAFFSFCRERYSFDDLDVANYRRLMLELRPGLVSFDPLWWKLALADYA